MPHIPIPNRIYCEHVTITRDTLTPEHTTLHATCVTCQKVVDVTVPTADFEAHERIPHTFIQDAYPSLTPDEREIIISSMCGSCFDSLFSDGEDA